jgi:hypothetical protein
VLDEIVFIIQFVKHGGISAVEIGLILLRSFCCAQRVVRYGRNEMHTELHKTRKAR